jgi:hypothetical protein
MNRRGQRVPGARSALIVANDSYQDAGLRRLRAPGQDAEALAHVLSDPAIGGFYVRVLMNQTEAKLRREVAGFFTDRRPDDLLLLYLSCHVVKDDSGQLYFATTDTDLTSLDATAIPAEFVSRHMTRSRSRRVVLLLDCCYSGAFARGMLARADQAVDLKERFEGRGRIVLTASSAMEYAFEEAELARAEGQPSIFTRALVRGLESGEADRDRDGRVSVDELYDYLFDEVRRLTPNQTPGRWNFEVRGDVMIARSPAVRSLEPQASTSARQEYFDRVAMAGQTVPDAAPRLGRSLAFEVVEGDILTFAADVVAFKYAQGFHGADWYAAEALAKVGVDMGLLEPKVGEHCLVESGRAIAAPQVLFVGVPPIGQLRYGQIRDFGTEVIRVLSKRVPDCRQLALTLHGPGFGLDEVEALFSLMTGCMEAVADRRPPYLERISVVEREAARVGRLRRALKDASHHSGELFVREAERGWLVALEGAAGLSGADQRRLSELPGRAAERKPKIFVAMPFTEELSDLFEFGIQRPVRELGFLCERVDQDVFTGDIMERVKSQIETSAAVIAVLTGANPNVYLEVGYALGRERPTILVSAEDPRFDLQGHRCLRYRRIKDVEEMLTRDLRVLKTQGHI